ncbi:Uncharacterised protein [Mycobacteroides abscessus]|nr:Uncharacterised protein [Mycobacteroides abscessus]
MAAALRRPRWVIDWWVTERSEADDPPLTHSPRRTPNTATETPRSAKRTKVRELGVCVIGAFTHQRSGVRNPPRPPRCLAFDELTAHHIDPLAAGS